MPQLPKLEKLNDGRFRVTYPNCKPIEFKSVPDSDGWETSINALHPLFKPKAVALIDALQKKLGSNYKIQINNSLRTKEQEEWLKRNKPNVQAKTYSPHCYGVAIDISVVDKKTGKAFTGEPSIKSVLEQTAKELGLMWGGWFQTMTKEPWHFQLAPLGTWEKMYESYKE